MNNFAAHGVTCLRLLVLTLLICSVAYPCVIWGIGQTIVPDSANGSLLVKEDGTVIGSRKLAQGFTKPEYFWPRPSAVNYDASATGGSNLSPLNPELRERVTAFQEQHGADSRPIPPDLVTASGSGMDPHITLGGALYQVERVAKTRGMTPENLRNFVESKAFHPGGPFTPGSLVNVLELNLELDGVESLGLIANDRERWDP